MLFLLTFVGLLSLSEIWFFSCQNLVLPAAHAILDGARDRSNKVALWLIQSVLPDKVVILIRALSFRYGYKIDEFMGRRNRIISAKAVNFGPSDRPSRCIEALVLADYKDVTAALHAVKFADHRMRLAVPLVRENFLFMHERMALEIEGVDFFGNKYRDVYEYGDSFLFPTTCPRFFAGNSLEVLKLYRDDVFVADILSFGACWSINGRRSLEKNIKWIIRDAMYANEQIFSSCMLGHESGICEADPGLLTVTSKFETERDEKALMITCDELHFT